MLIEEPQYPVRQDVDAHVLQRRAERDRLMPTKQGLLDAQCLVAVVTVRVGWGGDGGDGCREGEYIVLTRVDGRKKRTPLLSQAVVGVRQSASY